MMDEFLMVGTTKENRKFYISDLSDRSLKDNGIDGRTDGMFLYETSEEIGNFGIRVLASVPDLDAAYRLLEIIGAEIHTEETLT